MSITFNWFKGYKIRESRDYYGALISLIDHNATGHSARNVIEIQKIFEKITGKEIPIINLYIDFNCDTEAKNYMESILISPEEMSEMCNNVLKNIKTDEYDLLERIKWFKTLSDNGYFIAYESC